MRLECRSETSTKFWEPILDGDTVTVRFGRFGNDGQTHAKKLPTHDLAHREYRKLVCEKLAKGYKPTKKTVVGLFLKNTSAHPAAAISSLYIGEHVPLSVAEDICGWTTACIQNGMTPQKFMSVWDKLLNEDGGLMDSLGRTGAESWQDVTSWEEGELDDLYTKAVANGGDRFILFNNNSYFYIVALRGNPGARAIEICSLEEENCKDEDGQWLNDWPAEFGPGAPITSMYMTCDAVTLIDFASRTACDKEPRRRKTALSAHVSRRCALCFIKESNETRPYGALRPEAVSYPRL